MAAFYREADFLLQRFNFFLVATSFLIAALVVVATKTDPEAPLWLRRGIIVLGCGISSFFSAVNFGNSVTLKRFRDYVFDIEERYEPVRGLQPPFRQVLPALYSDRRRDRFPLLHTWIVPLAMFFFWSFSGFYSKDSTWFVVTATALTALPAILMLLVMAWQLWIGQESFDGRLGGEAMKGRLFIVIVVLVFLAPFVYGIVQRGEIKPADWMQIAVTAILVLITGFYAWSAKETLRQATQLTRANLEMACREHNWKLLECQVNPGLPDLPPNDDANKEYWKWRIVHLDHLGLLMTQWQGWRSKALTKDEMEAWQGWAGLLRGELERDRSEALKRLGTESASARQIMEFDGTPERLRSLLHISESHNWDMLPADFVAWLLGKCRFETLGLTPKR